MTAEAMANPAAEWSVVGTLLQDGSMIAETVGTQLQSEDFTQDDARLLYATVVERFYADLPVEPLTVADAARRKLAEAWGVGEPEVAATLLTKLREAHHGSGALEHAAIVKRLSVARKLLNVSTKAATSLIEGKLTPEEVAGRMSAEALAVTGGMVSRTELLGWMDSGSQYAQYLARLRAAKERGIELAVYTGYPFIDGYTMGLAPTELCFIAGAPGVGKSVLGWKAAEGFANRQVKKPVEHRIGTLVVSMEMGLVPSNTRLAQSITGIDGMRLREGDISDNEFNYILREWKARDGLPIYFNYASNFRLSQLRALVVEAIRRYNVGFVVIDHFRQIDPDRHIENSNDADEVKVRFLKESIAKDLNVAVLCLAHTVKLSRADGLAARPRLSDLRGSGQISANADFVAFMHKPGKNLDDAERMALGIGDTDAELIWEKARHTEDGTAYFRFEPSTMTISPR